MRHFAVLLVLLTQVFSVFAPGAFVWCVHGDGQVELELVGSECCRDAREAECAPSAQAPVSDEPTLRASGDDCRDVPVKAEQTTVARSRLQAESSHAERAAPAAVVAWSAAPVLLPSRFELPSFRGPPAEAVPRRMRLLVLRC